MTAIQLTTIGSSCVQLRAAPAALVAGGVQIEKVSYTGTILENRLTLSLTGDETRALVRQIEAALAGGCGVEPVRAGTTAHRELGAVRISDGPNRELRFGPNEVTSAMEHGS